MFLGVNTEPVAAEALGRLCVHWMERDQVTSASCSAPLEKRFSWSCRGTVTGRPPAQMFVKKGIFVSKEIP